MAAAKKANPDATDKQIGEVVGVTVQRVLSHKCPANPEPKLLNHGEKKADTGYNGNVLPERGNKADYILARLQRDGYSDENQTDRCYL